MTRAPIVVTNILLIISALFSLADSPSTVFSDYIGQQWLLGKKKEVLQVAEERLQKNSNDLSSLLITLDYAVEFMELDRMRSVIPKIKAVSATTSSPRFDKHKAILASSLNVFEQMLPTITPAMVEAEARKGLINNKPLSSLFLIQDLEADGLVPRLAPQEQALFQRRQ